MNTSKPYVTYSGEESASDIYTRLRKEGRVTSFLFTSPSCRNPEWARLVSALRRLAQKEGLTVVSSSIERYGRGDRRNDAQAFLVHPDDPSTIVRPGVEAAR